MAQMSAGKRGAMMHNSGNIADNRKTGHDAGKKGGKRRLEHN